MMLTTDRSRSPDGTPVLVFDNAAVYTVSDFVTHCVDAGEFVDDTMREWAKSFRAGEWIDPPLDPELSDRFLIKAGFDLEADDRPSCVPYAKFAAKRRILRKPSGTQEPAIIGNFRRHPDVEREIAEDIASIETDAASGAPSTDSLQRSSELQFRGGRLFAAFGDRVFDISPSRHENEPTGDRFAYRPAIVDGQAFKLVLAGYGDQEAVLFVARIFPSRKRRETKWMTAWLLCECITLDRSRPQGAASTNEHA